MILANFKVVSKYEVTTVISSIRSVIPCMHSATLW